MKKPEVTEILKALGWTTRKDEVGDSVAYYTLSDRDVQIIYKIDKVPKEEWFISTLSVSNDEFNTYCSKIFKERKRFSHLVPANKGIDIRAPEILEQHINQASAQAIEWAKQQDLDAALQEYRLKKPVDCWGTLPVKHLAALAILGDIDKLKFYQTSFAAGDRLGFVPYITKDFIDRAVALAEQRLNGK